MKKILLVCGGGMSTSQIDLNFPSFFESDN